MARLNLVAPRFSVLGLLEGIRSVDNQEKIRAETARTLALIETEGLKQENAILTNNILRQTGLNAALADTANTEARTTLTINQAGQVVPIATSQIAFRTQQTRNEKFKADNAAELREAVLAKENSTAYANVQRGNASKATAESTPLITQSTIAKNANAGFASYQRGIKARAEATAVPLVAQSKINRNDNAGFASYQQGVKSRAEATTVPLVAQSKINKNANAGFASYQRGVKSRAEATAVPLVAQSKISKNANAGFASYQRGVKSRAEATAVPLVAQSRIDKNASAGRASDARAEKSESDARLNVVKENNATAIANATVTYKASQTDLNETREAQAKATGRVARSVNRERKKQIRASAGAHNARKKLIDKKIRTLGTTKANSPAAELVQIELNCANGNKEACKVRDEVFKGRDKKSRTSVVADSTNLLLGGGGSTAGDLEF